MGLADRGGAMICDVADAVARMEALGRSGLVVSVCYGPSAGVLRWSVQCMFEATGAEFTRSFAARDFQQCVEIAELEAAKRGWWTPP